jgi:16S rRNA (guanine(966)-N(2))-methyltransferase RsmD
MSCRPRPQRGRNPGIYKLRTETLPTLHEVRIIAGRFKGRRLNPPRKNPARPITDFAKEGLFNVLANYFDFDRVKFLELFAGTGSVSFEMASRGCEDITLVELYRPNVEFIRKTSEILGIEIEIITGDVFQFIPGCREKYLLIFAGPPYGHERLPMLPDLIFRHELLMPKGWFILEHSKAHKFEEHPRFFQKRNYGQAIFSIFSQP